MISRHRRSVQPAEHCGNRQTYRIGKYG
jgi:hypothetical protein